MGINLTSADTVILHGPCPFPRTCAPGVRVRVVRAHSLAPAVCAGAVCGSLRAASGARCSNARQRLQSEARGACMERVICRHVRARAWRVSRASQHVYQSEYQQECRSVWRVVSVSHRAPQRRAGCVRADAMGTRATGHVDLDFNPMIDRQAEDRCHRIGQVPLPPLSSCASALRARARALNLTGRSGGRGT